jgi:hypothetical protein
MGHLFQQDTNLELRTQQHPTPGAAVIEIARRSHEISGALDEVCILFPRTLSPQFYHFYTCLDKPQASSSASSPAVSKAVFAVPIVDALQVAQIGSLPAVVFRCIQYLEAKKADQEEGIYRLSGSSAVIKSLKDRFNAG